MPENHVLLQRTELSQSSSSVTFSNIPQSGYTDLKVVCSTRTDYAGFLDLNMYFNGNASSGYSWLRLNGDGGSVTSNSSASAGVIPSATLGTTSTANTFASAEIYIPNYRSSNAKIVSIDSVTENNAAASYMVFTSGSSTLSTAITSISFGLGAGNFVTGSTFSLYGIAAVGTAPAIAPKASGGNIISTDGTYWIHTFLSSGTFTPQTTLTCEYLVVAGGGSGGGGTIGGGGGAGGYRTGSLSVVPSTLTVTVGAGGSGTSTLAPGNNGSNSVFSTISSTGGGGGGRNGSPTNAGSGGSGGGSGEGASPGAGNAGSYSPVEGYAGGNASDVDPGYGSGGGGGASRAGWGGTSTAGGYGADGLASSISGTSVIYAGGGGGGTFGSTAAPGLGGAGGGGAGGNYALATTGTNGTANRGGGGGGTGNGASGSGGSGIVIIRYPRI